MRRAVAMAVKKSAGGKAPRPRQTAAWLVNRVADHGESLGTLLGPALSRYRDPRQRALVQELGVTYPTGTTSESSVVRDFQVTGMPSTYFIKPNGEVVRKWTGLLTETKLSELVQELLEAAASS